MSFVRHYTHQIILLDYGSGQSEKDMLIEALCRNYWDQRYFYDLNCPLCWQIAETYSEFQGK